MKYQKKQTEDFKNKRVWGPEPKYPCVTNGLYEVSPELIVIAGPCSIESPKQIDNMVKVLRSNCVDYMRGGVYRAGTYPREKQGLEKELIKYWHNSCRLVGLKNIIEIIDIRQIDYLSQYCDAFQVGARHMQDYALLNELAKFNRTVMLKRNMGSTLDEFLGAAEYLARGKCSPILIERGSSTHMNHVRWDLSLSLIAAIKKMTGIPIIIDASHGTGRRDLVADMTLGGIAVGADGFLVEVHEKPEKSLSDADQALPLSALPLLIKKSEYIRAARRIS